MNHSLAGSDPPQVIRRERAAGNLTPLTKLVDTRKLSDDELLHIACVDLIAMLRAGKGAKVEDYLSLFPSLRENRDSVLDLIDAEICALRELGTEPSSSDFKTRFPDFAESIDKMFAFDSAGDAPDLLGGYELQHVVGRGAMGVVYKARQLSLDRDVAVKVIQGKWAANPTALARFVREAYAAARLTHHNVVQVYDFGSHEGQFYFSMEWVPEGSLSDRLRKQGRFRSKVAASYILQAARGLSFAHGHGMVHRDVKPANLLINGDGVVKVADLGLVKTPDSFIGDESDSVGRDIALHPSGSSNPISGSGSHVTGFGNAVGTPAYMAPEQAIDAGSVDARADIFSLGRTLYQFVLGATPKPDIEVDLDALPTGIREIVKRSTARNPDNRYSSADDMIQDLETYLELDTDTAYKPTHEEASEIEILARTWLDHSNNRLIATVLLGSAIIGLLATALIGVSSVRLAMLPFSLSISVPVTFLIAAGFWNISPLGAVVVQYLAESSHVRWLKWISIGLLIYVGLWALGMHWYVVLGELLGAAAGGAIAYWCYQNKTSDPAPASPKVESLLRRIRLKGVHEDKLRDFVCEHAGPNWEHLYEGLFGFDALVKAKHHKASDNGEPVRLTIRQRLMQAMLQDLRTNKDAKDQQTIANVESMSLTSMGMSKKEADERAWRVANALMQASQSLEKLEDNKRLAAASKRARVKAMLADARSGVYVSESNIGDIAREGFFGQLTRLFIGIALCVVVLFMARLNGINLDRIADAWSAPLESGGSAYAWVHESGLIKFAFGERQGDWAADSFMIRFAPFSLFAAGLFLVATSFFQGHRIARFVFPAALCTIAGPLLVASSMGFQASAICCAAIGSIMTGAGIVFGRTREESNLY